MRSLSYALSGAACSAITSVFLQADLWHTVQAAALSAIAAGSVRWLAGVAARPDLRQHDIAAMMVGACPVCHTNGSLQEVTSTSEGTLVKCIRETCRQRFDIRRGENGPTVLRLGSGILKGIEDE